VAGDELDEDIMLYVRQKDIENQHLRCLRQVTFQTKLVMAAELTTWAARWRSPAVRWHPST
jgi:hypothetical protein